jgi:hypothetical protein
MSLRTRELGSRTTALILAGGASAGAGTGADLGGVNGTRLCTPYRAQPLVK